jgi:hypothetical protein
MVTAKRLLIGSAFLSGLRCGVQAEIALEVEFLVRYPPGHDFETNDPHIACINTLNTLSPENSTLPNCLNQKNAIQWEIANFTCGGAGAHCKFWYIHYEPRCDTYFGTKRELESIFSTSQTPVFTKWSANILRYG